MMIPVMITSPKPHSVSRMILPLILILFAGGPIDFPIRSFAAAPGPKTCCVDSARGADANPGTEARPWKTVQRVNEAMASLRPGDRVLFRRRGAWLADVLKIRAKGTPDAPIAFGAYGPPGDPRPSLFVVNISESEHIIVRDLELSHSRSGPCLAAEHSGYLTVINNVVHDTASNGIAYHALTHHTATIDNVIYNVAANDGISIHDRNWGTTPEPVGSHHWVVGNIIYTMGREDCIDAASSDGVGTPDAKAGEDIKIIGNRCLHANAHGIVAGHDTRRVWVIGNTILDCGRNTANAMAFGTGGSVQVSGNLLIDNMRRVQFDAPARFEHNTIVTRNGIRTSIVIGPRAAGTTVRHNLVLTNFREWLSVDCLGVPPSGGISISQSAIASNWNWFCTTNPAGGQMRRGSVYPFPDWQSQFHQDTHSKIGPVPLPALPPPDQIETDASKWDIAFFAAFIPPPDWPGFKMNNEPPGAFSPKGDRQGIKIDPLPNYPDNQGLGWPGPPIIQERYPCQY